jgi:hypothetical protein
VFIGVALLAALLRPLVLSVPTSTDCLDRLHLHSGVPPSLPLELEFRGGAQHELTLLAYSLVEARKERLVVAQTGPSEPGGGACGEAVGILISIALQLVATRLRFECALLRVAKLLVQGAPLRFHLAAQLCKTL